MRGRRCVGKHDRRVRRSTLTLPCPSQGRERVLERFAAGAPSSAGEAWTRIYCFEGGEEIVRSVKHAGRGPWLEERAGPPIMRLAVFEERGALVFECIDFLLRIGPMEIPLPVELTPGRIRVEHHDYGDGRFAFKLEARHPWFGVTFRQSCELHNVEADSGSGALNSHLERNAFGLLQARNDGEQIGGLRIAARTEHAHQTLCGGTATFRQ